MLDDVRREQVYNSLSPMQREFLDNQVKKGKATVWLNALARHKGAHLTEVELQDYRTSVKKYLDWELIDMIDHGERKHDVRCKCGAMLRYQYILVNMATAETVSFGQTCLHNHMGLPNNVVADVVSGIKEINLERNEILDRVLRGWNLKIDILQIEVPKGIRDHLEVGLPLTNRQERHLHRLMREKRDEEERKLNAMLKRQLEERLSSGMEPQWNRNGINANEDPFEKLHPAHNYGKQYRVLPSKANKTQISYQPEPVRMDISQMRELISYMITGEANGTAFQRLCNGLLYVKMHPSEFDQSVLEEAKDAAMVGQTHEHYSDHTKRWIDAIQRI